MTTLPYTVVRAGLDDVRIGLPGWSGQLATADELATLLYRPLEHQFDHADHTFTAKASSYKGSCWYSLKSAAWNAYIGRVYCRIADYQIKGLSVHLWQVTRRYATLTTLLQQLSTLFHFTAADLPTVLTDDHLVVGPAPTWLDLPVLLAAWHVDVVARARDILPCFVHRRRAVTRDHRFSVDHEEGLLWLTSRGFGSRNRDRIYDTQACGRTRGTHAAIPDLEPGYSVWRIEVTARGSRLRRICGKKPEDSITLRDVLGLREQRGLAPISYAFEHREPDMAAITASTTVDRWCHHGALTDASTAYRFFRRYGHRHRSEREWFGPPSDLTELLDAALREHLGVWAADHMITDAFERVEPEAATARLIDLIGPFRSSAPPVRVAAQPSLDNECLVYLQSLAAELKPEKGVKARRGRRMKGTVASVLTAIIRGVRDTGADLDALQNERRLRRFIQRAVAGHAQKLGLERVRPNAASSGLRRPRLDALSSEYLAGLATAYLPETKPKAMGGHTQPATVASVLDAIIRGLIAARADLTTLPDEQQLRKFIAAAVKARLAAPSD
jgi:hypothetical protein